MCLLIYTFLDRTGVGDGTGSSDEDGTGSSDGDGTGSSDEDGTGSSDGDGTGSSDEDGTGSSDIMFFFLFQLFLFDSRMFS